MGRSRNHPQGATGRAPWVIGALALGLHLLLLGLYHCGPEPRPLAGDETRYVRRATRLAQGAPIEPSSLWPSGYETLISLPLRIGDLLGLDPPLLAVQAFQVLLWWGASLAFWMIAQRLLPCAATRLLALGLLLLNPTYVAFSHFFWPEIPHLLCYLLILWLLITGRDGLAVYLGMAILLALSMSLKLVYLPIAVGLAVLLPLLHLRKAPRARSVLLLPLVLFLLHGRTLHLDSGCFNAWVGLNDVERTDWGEGAIVGKELGLYLRSAPTPDERSRKYRQKIRRLIETRGPVRTLTGQLGKQYFRLFDHRTFFTKQLPGGMAPRYPFRSLAIARALRIINGLIWGVTLIGFAVGAVLLSSPPFGWLQVLLGVVAYNLGVFLVLHVKTRYVIQFLPILCLVSARGWGALAQGQLSRTRLGLGLLLSALLLLLGFRDLLGWS